MSGSQVVNQLQVLNPAPGRAVEADCPNDLEQVNVTEQLDGSAAANHDSMDETMEELESLMLRLEQVSEVGTITNDVRTKRGVGMPPHASYSQIPLSMFQGFQAVLDPLLAPKPKRGIEGTIGEIGDLVNAFATQFIQHHEL